MVISRAVQATGCSACRVSLLRTFTSLPLATVRTHSASNAQPSRRYPRNFRHVTNDATSLPRAEARIVEPDSQESQAKLVDSEEAEVSEYKPVEAIPWYLQVDAPQTQTQPLSKRQELPELPEHPPPLLQPLLQQISVDLGLDDLTLLDLRKLDPPPALGANLLMIIGTARSERHLHVSADRLCRWLRTNYHLRPDADGLIGRNELKLRLKRKAKRARLMGNANDESYDDGVRTGWVCVDVGVVEAAEGAEVVPEPENFVGFGRRTDGVRIVVQMLTEEKREEVNLEKLWGDVLKRGGKMDIDEEFVQDRLGVAEFARRNTAAPKVKVASSRFQDTRSPILSQARQFHTSSRRLADDLVDTLRSVPDFDVYHTYGVGALQGIQRNVLQLLSSAEFQKARDLLLQNRETQPLLQGEEWQRFLLYNLRSYLEELPEEQALQALGNGADDQISTPFLKMFYDAITRFPNQAQAEAKLWLHFFALEHQHPGYDQFSLYAVYKEVQLAGVPLSTSTFLTLITHLLHTSGSRSYHGPPPQTIHRITQIIRQMSDQGHNILSEEVLIPLQLALAPGLDNDLPPEQIYTNSPETFDLPSHPLLAIQKRLHLLIMHLRMPLISESSRLTLMESYASQHNWLEFFEIFRLAARHGKPRSDEFYASMFVLVASTMHLKGVQSVLRYWVAEMEKEVPKVTAKGNVGIALGYCLQVADPRGEEEFKRDPKGPGEWMRLRRMIERDSKEM